MTSPRCPVMVNCLPPRMRVASIKMMSPPTGVQTSPTATPGLLTRSSTSFSVRNFGTPRKGSRGTRQEARRCRRTGLDGNAGPLDAFLDFLFRAEFRYAQEFADHFRCDDHLLHLAFGHAPRLFARNRRDLALQVAHARFSREAVDDLLQAFVRELDLLAHCQTVLLGLLRDQVFMRDVKLLFACVPG